MTNAYLLDEAEQCRQRAQAYVGQPEATFLLKAAREFERLAYAACRTVEDDDPPAGFGTAS